MTQETIGSRIREQRMRLGLSQQALANKAGVTQGLIGQIEAGINKGSKHTVAIARALGVTPDWLEGGDSPPSEQQLLGGVSPLSAEHQWLIRTWDAASEEAREVARFALSDIDAPLPAWADKDMRKDVNNMIHVAQHWLRGKQPRREEQPQWEEDPRKRAAA